MHQVLPDFESLDEIVHQYGEGATLARLAWTPQYNLKLERRLARVTCPSLVVRAEDDRLIPDEMAERYAELLPNSRIETIPGTGHALARRAAGEGRRRDRRLHPGGRAPMNKLDFYLFHLMPYPYIPPGEEIESTWVTLPNSHYDPKVGHRLYNEYLEQLIAGEKLGYDGAVRERAPPERVRHDALAEHHGVLPRREDRAHPDRRDRQRAAAACATRVRVAEEIAMLDVISGGRIISGFVRGTGMEYYSYAANPSYSQERFWEAHDLIIKAWTEPGPFALAGQALPPAVREPVAAAAPAAAPAGLAAGLRLDGDDQEGGRAALSVHDGVRAAVVHEGELRHVPARGRGGRLRGLAQAARGGDPDLRRRDRGAGAPRGEAAHHVAVPERAEDPALPLVPARLHEQEVVRGHARREGQAQHEGPLRPDLRGAARGALHHRRARPRR